MKRSEMITAIKEFLYGKSYYPGHSDLAEALLNTIEKLGMLPPKTDEGPIVNGWEPEGLNREGEGKP